jgi:hypothetical protein
MAKAEHYTSFRHLFPWPGNNLALFFAAAVAKQFTWLFASIPLGLLMTLPCLAGLWLLWNGQPSGERSRCRLIVGMIATMFALVALSAMGHFHPFGGSRHTGFLGIFIAVSIAVAFERLVRGAPGLVLPAALVLLPAWQFAGKVEHRDNVTRIDPWQRDQMLAGIEYLREQVPGGATILLDQETRRLVAYYAGPSGPSRVPRDQSAPEWRSGDYRLVSYRFTYRSIDEVIQDLRRFRGEYRVPAAVPVWLIDGGWNFFEYRNTPYEQFFRAGIKKFGNALWIVRAPPEVGDIAAY